MLPTEVENLVGHYAFGVGKKRYNLCEELDFCAANRGMIPDSFLAHAVTLDGYAREPAPPLSCYTVKNPLRTDTPFFPWALIDKRSYVFGNAFPWWCGMILMPTFRKLKTYRSTFQTHVVRMFNRGRDMSQEWNAFVNRYRDRGLPEILTNPKSYDLLGHEHVFKVICEELENAGYLSPVLSLPPRPSQRSVLSPTSSLRV